ncbi:hypothetical protein [Vibrio sp. B1Z05]|uniref:glycosyltransferase family protein n=1 Tax=Vibrio sp. B1Z05 TaxID=2654980 RepID=UPI00128C02BD|nr:hypothetical protein [Vibrio sp. B1Z05]MPW36246.1 hypothetical protein [Vibrio sp. B1Z05]
MEKIKLIFISNITLGYSSPKYISFINLVNKKFDSVDIETYERWDYPRPIYDIPGFSFKRNVLSGWLECIKPKKNRVWFRLLRNISLFISEFKMIINIISQAKNNRLIIVTTFENPLFGLINSENVLILQNYSEIWTEDHLNFISKSQAMLLSPLLKKYRNNVNLCVSPQYDRLLLARDIYRNAKHYLVLNCPPFESVSSTGKNFDQIRVLYQGVIGKTNYPYELMSLLLQLSEIYEVHFAGKVQNVFEKEFNQLVKDSSIVDHGYLNQFQLAELRSKCNVGIVFWDESNLNTKYCAPNKLFEYMSCGYFVISSKNHSLNKFYENYNYGLNIDVHSENLNNAVSELDIKEMIRISNNNMEHCKKLLNFESQNEELMQELSYFIDIENP